MGTYSNTGTGGKTAAGVAAQLATDTAAVTAAKASLLPSATVLGVTGTFGLDALMVNAGFMAGKVSMTISSTGVDPAFTAVTLADADFVWVAPNGTSFTGKAPAGASFIAGGAGTYLVYCTDWSAVTALDCSFDTVTALDVACVTGLTTLDCSNNDIATLDMSSNTSLESLTCNDMATLVSLDITDCASLTDLNCSDTSLTTLDLSDNTELSEMYCSDTHITSFDLSANTKLLTLICHRNNNGNDHLTTLDISHNTWLTTLDAQLNHLTVAAVDAILAAIRTAGEGFGDLNLSGQTPAAVPGVQGQLDVTYLRDTGSWTVLVDTA